MKHARQHRKAARLHQCQNKTRALGQGRQGMSPQQGLQSAPPLLLCQKGCGGSYNVRRQVDFAL